MFPILDTNLWLQEGPDQGKIYAQTCPKTNLSTQFKNWKTRFPLMQFFLFTTSPQSFFVEIIPQEFSVLFYETLISKKMVLASLLSLFPVKDQNQSSMKIIMEWFHQKLLKTMINSKRAMISSAEKKQA